MDGHILKSSLKSSGRGEEEGVECCSYLNFMCSGKVVYVYALVD